MKYTYGENREEEREKTGVKGSTLLYAVMVCAVAAGAMMIRNVCLSTVSPVLGGLDKLTGDSNNYAKALSALGQAVSGEKTFSDAISEACEYAFGTDSVGIPAAADSSADDVYTINYPSSAYGEETGALWTAAEIPAEKFSADEAAVAAFTESQAKYTDRAGIPATVTFDMPAIEFDCICPVMGSVSSTFGYRIHPVDSVLRFHYGTDIAAEKGTGVSVFADGTVTSAGDSSSYGLYVIVEHPGDAVSLYAHMNSVAVNVGDRLTMGDTVGTVGSSGNATGPCLHFEIRVDGKYVNPEYYVSWT